MCVRCTGITHVPGIRDTNFRRIGIDISIGFEHVEEMPEACNLPSLGRIFLFKARVCLNTIQFAITKLFTLVVGSGFTVSMLYIGFLSLARAFCLSWSLHDLAVCRHGPIG